MRLNDPLCHQHRKRKGKFQNVLGTAHRLTSSKLEKPRSSYWSESDSLGFLAKKAERLMEVKAEGWELKCRVLCSALLQKGCPVPSSEK